MYAQVTSAGLFGMNAFLVEVESELARGLAGFEVVGLPDAAVKESREPGEGGSGKTPGLRSRRPKSPSTSPPADLHKTGADLRSADLPLAAQGVRQHRGRLFGGGLPRGAGAWTDRFVG